MNYNFKALKSGVWYTLSNFFLRSIGLLTTPIFARLLSKYEFGIYNNYTSWLGITMIFLTLNLESTLISARYDYEKKLDQYLFSILFLSTSITMTWIVIINLFSSFFTKILNLDIISINAMLIYILFFPAVNLFQARERYLFEYKKSVFISIVLSLSTAILSVVLVMTLQNRLYGRIFGAIIPTIIIGLILYMFFYIKGKQFKFCYWKYALPICIPYIPHLLSLTLLNSIDRVMITKWCGAEKAAIYSLAYTCGSMVILFGSSLNSAYAPWLGDKLAKNDFESIRRVSKSYIIWFFLVAFGLILIAPEILFVLGGKKYYDSLYVIAPVTIGCVFQFLYTLFVNIEQFKKKTLGMAFASIVAAIINIILNFIFIPRFGYMAAAYTTLVGYMMLLFMHMFLVYRLKYTAAYSYKLIFVIIGISFISLIIATILYKFLVIRYSILGIYILVILILLIKMKKKLTGVVANVKRRI